MNDKVADMTDQVGATTARGTLREFLVEFLGSLVPGIAFLVSMVPGFIVPATAALFGLFKLPWPQVGFPTGVPASITTILFLIIPGVLAFLVFAYLAGHFFYRQDPKIADEASFKKIPRHVNFDGMVRPIPGMANPPVEFPYHFLKQYLLDRGLKYLAVHVPWNKQNKFNRRAKHFANALKLRVALESPLAFAILARNEAHVRLSSSMWYVSRALILASGLGFAIYGLSVISPDVKCSPLVILPLIMVLLSWLTKWAIERSLHYQREREVLFILEVAHWLWHTKRVPKIFDGISPTTPSSTRKKVG